MQKVVKNKRKFDGDSEKKESSKKPPKIQKKSDTSDVKQAKKPFKSDKKGDTGIKKHSGSKDKTKSSGDFKRKDKDGQKPAFKGKFNTGKPQFNKKQGEKVTPPPNWAEFKQKKKELREKRRGDKVSKNQPGAHAVVTQVKLLGEKLRRKKLSKEESTKLTQELHTILSKGHYQHLALAHDTTRVIQWLLKFASPTIQKEVADQLVGLTVAMLQSKYARNCVKRILKYGTQETRDKVLKSLQGNIVKLSSHTLSAPILDYAYVEIASKQQKYQLHQEFFGDMYKTNKDDSIRCLKDTFKNSPEIKTAILGATKANLLRVLNKNVHDCGLVHAVLYDFLSECSGEDRSELITTLSPLIAALSNSKLGAKAAAICVWHGTNKDKKTILKVMKEQAVALSTHEFGHSLILSILSSVDDTVLVGKTVLAALLMDVIAVASNEWGRKVLAWLVAPGDNVHFHPTVSEWLVGGATQGGSKKPQDIRRSELLQASLPPLVASIKNEPHFWLSSGNVGLLTVAILKAVEGGDRQACLEAVSRHICRTDWKLKEDDKEVLGVEHSALHSCLKKLAQYDKFNVEKGRYTFGQAVIANYTDEVIKEWILSNRGCFLLLLLLENNAEDVQSKMKTTLSKHAKQLKKQTTAGAKLLLGKIK